MTMRRRFRLNYLAACLAAAFATGAPSAALACGGFFCSASQPVNQAAERILFADNDDGTVTAVIQILYEGPSESFSWLLPLPSVPSGDQIGIASDLAFVRLQNATNPVYNLATTIQGPCQPILATPDGGGGPGNVPEPPNGGSVGGAVMVEASGMVGPFDWTVISVDPELVDPADASGVAIEWLGDNGYDVPEGAPGLLGPYLAEGMYLLAVRLTKGTDTGSIRPIVVTYEGEVPMIPVRLTAVAANDDMGVMTWLLGEARAVPFNYRSLELNEARINWFNASSNYNDVVIAAADDAGGQGFVTELAGPTTTLAGVVWTPGEESQWQALRNRVYVSFADIFQTTYGSYGSYDGYWDAVRSTVALPEGVSFEDFQLCPACYADDITFSPAAFLDALEAAVVAPMRDVQELIDDHGYVTRMYTTLSAAEMTVDPAFVYNPDLEDYGNVHTAQRIIDCTQETSLADAPWRIELPQGGVVRGIGTNGVWPDAFAAQPSNYRVMQYSDSGDGREYEDNSDDIEADLDEYNAGIEAVLAARGGASSAGSGGSTGSGGTNVGVTGGAGASGSAAGPGDLSAQGGDSGCSLGRGSLGGAAVSVWIGLGLLALGRRRSREGGQSP